MKDHPIIFSGPMILALIAGRKTQTRRLASSPLAKVQPGDRLWTRETAWYEPADAKPSDFKRMIWSVTGAHLPRDLFEGMKQAPSIHQPLEASRLTLPVESVRFQRLHDISEDDALAEGVCHALEHHKPGMDMGKSSAAMRRAIVEGYFGSARQAFEWLWGLLHHKPGERWEDNPEIVALTFAVVEGNITKVAA